MSSSNIVLGKTDLYAGGISDSTIRPTYFAFFENRDCMIWFPLIVNFRAEIGKQRTLAMRMMIRFKKEFFLLGFTNLIRNSLL